MNKRPYQGFMELSFETNHPYSRKLDVSDVPREREDWGSEITAYLRRIMQQHCLESRIEHRRSERSFHTGARELDIVVSYPVGHHERFVVALNALGQHWPIHEAEEQPVYITFLTWGGEVCYVHIYDGGEDLSMPSDSW